MPPSALQNTPKSSSTDLAQAAYDALAPFYDEFTADYVYDEWLQALETWARAHGLRGKRVLDAACGTGKSFLPLLRRGYEVTACDISAEMVEIARKKATKSAEIVVADMRSLPWVDRFDLITCLDDAINYLLTREELEAALTSMWAALRPGGVLIFDANSLGACRDAFSATFERGDSDRRFRWHGEADPDLAPGALCAAMLEVVERDGCIQTRHVQRHWPASALRTAASSVGFEGVVLRGQIAGGRLLGDPDELRHSKVVCLGRRAPRDSVRSGAPEADTEVNRVDPQALGRRRGTR